MKDLVEFVKESYVTEGGHSIPGAGSIPGDKTLEVCNQIIGLLRKQFGKDLKASPLGSTGKKSKDQTSGDIDIALEMSWADDMPRVKEFMHGRCSVMGNTNEQLHVFNIGWEWDPGKIVQVDFMFVNDLEFAKFAYHSPDFTKNESKFKGMHQSALLMAVAANTPTNKPEEKFSSEYDGKYKGVLKSYWQYRFDANDGLLLVKKTFEGKLKPLSSEKTIKDSTVKVTKDIKKILAILLGPDAEPADCNSFESLLAYLVSDKYIYRSKEQLEKIKKHFMEDWQLNMKMGASGMAPFGKIFDDAIRMI